MTNTNNYDDTNLSYDDTNLSYDDCLVLKLENTNLSVYIFYDFAKKKYIIRGKTYEDAKRETCETCEYSFESKNKKILANFLFYINIRKSYVIDKYPNLTISDCWTGSPQVIEECTSLNEILLNYKHFPYDSNEISFDYLSYYDTNNTKIQSINKIKQFDELRMLKILKFLKHIKNDF